MEEALEILWTYARREPLDSNGETVIPTINNSIAAISIIMHLEGWGSEKRKMNSEKRATHDKPAHGCRGEWQFAQPKNTQYNTDNDTNNHNPDMGELLTYSALADFAPTPAQHNTDNYEGELPFAPTPAQHQFAQPQSTQPQYPQPNTAHNNYACLVAPSPSERGGRGISSPSPAIHSLLLPPPLSTSLITRC